MPTDATRHVGLGTPLLLLLGIFAAGCGEPNALGRKAISGEIVFDGSPLDSGLIEFTPADPDGVSTGASISDGKYSVEAHQGVPPGDYTVRITSPTDSLQDELESLAPPGPQDNGPRQPPPARERIPAEYNVRSDKTVTVTEDGTNRFDFDIPAAKR